MLADLSAREWAEWLAYYALEPWGFPAADQRLGLLASTVAAPHMPRGKKVDPSDFMLGPRLRGAAEQPSPRGEAQALVMRLRAAGVVVRERRED